MKGHPTSFELEASHAEGQLGPLEPHLSGCGVCRASLDELERERATFLAARPAGAFVRQVRQRFEAEQRVDTRHRGWLLQLVPLGALVAVLQLAFGWPFIDGPRGTPRAALPSELATPAPTAAAPKAAPSEAAPSEAAAPWHAPDLAGKGGGGPALIVRRDDAQFLAHGVAAIQPGDELRLRFELSAPGRIEAGILLASGEWVPFVAGQFAAGQHTPAATLRVDDEPSSGTLLLGAPGEVARARAGAAGAEVQTLRIEWKPLR
jgi:hypothetical protein